jgi:D-alanyl-D-alanine carboxypeptidase/D-alanyl-D-alanine-endopeptidase (penicillin-binding protein 4)
MNDQFRKYFLLFLVAIWIGPGCATSRLRIDGKNLDRYIEESNLLGNGFSGFLLYDPLKKEIIHDHHGYRFFTPASNTKIFTFYTAKKILGDSIPSLAYALLQDTLYFTGLGDPTFLHPDFEFQPGLDFLLRESRQLVYVPNLFEDNRFGPGWAWDDFLHDYSAERSAFPIFGNLVRIRKLSKNSGIWIMPRIKPTQTMVRKDTTHLLDPGEFLITREEYNNRIDILYQSPFDFIDERIPFLTNDTLVRNLLEDTLKKKIIIKQQFPEGGKKILYSQPTDSLLRPMMTESDNFFAEQLLLMSSWILFDTLSVEKVIEFAQQNYFLDLKNEMFWVDGSGLSRYNQFTPHAIITVLEMIYSELGRDYLTDIFPAAGLSGTMKKNFPDLRGFVYAKTGSMSQVYNLSGFLITQKGRWVIFSFMNNNFVNDPADIRKEMTRILMSVRNKF